MNSVFLVTSNKTNGLLLEVCMNRMHWMRLTIGAYRYEYLKRKTWKASNRPKAWERKKSTPSSYSRVHRGDATRVNIGTTWLSQELSFCHCSNRERKAEIEFVLEGSNLFAKIFFLKEVFLAVTAGHNTQLHILYLKTIGLKYGLLKMGSSGRLE